MKKIIVTLMLLVLFITSMGSAVHAATQVSGVANINSATKAELVLLPGVGESKATAIINQRESQKFSSKEDLLLVKGIGEKMLSKMTANISLAGPSTIQQVKETKTN